MRSTLISNTSIYSQHELINNVGVFFSEFIYNIYMISLSAISFIISSTDEVVGEPGSARWAGGGCGISRMISGSISPSLSHTGNVSVVPCNWHLLLRQILQRVRFTLVVWTATVWTSTVWTATETFVGDESGMFTGGLEWTGIISCVEAAEVLGVVSSSLFSILFL